MASPPEWVMFILVRKQKHFLKPDEIVMTQFKLLHIGGISIHILAAVLLVLVAMAAWVDIKSRRIPNWLILLGLITSLMLHVYLNNYDGFKAWSLGFLVGLGGFMPLYLMRAMGAGDVKLMAMVGSFLGPISVLGAMLTTLAAGGVLAIVMALYNGALQQALINVRAILTLGMYKTMSGGGVQLEAPPASAGNLPYAVAIAVGTLIHLILVGSGLALLA